MLADNEESEFVELEKAKASKKKQIKHKAQVTKKDKTLAKDIQEDEDDFVVRNAVRSPRRRRWKFVPLQTVRRFYSLFSHQKIRSLWVEHRSHEY